MRRLLAWLRGLLPGPSTEEGEEAEDLLPLDEETEATRPAPIAAAVAPAAAEAQSPGEADRDPLIGEGEGREDLSFLEPGPDLAEFEELEYLGPIGVDDADED